MEDSGGEMSNEESFKHLTKIILGGFQGEFLTSLAYGLKCT
jgi:hypothetical protein